MAAPSQCDEYFFYHLGKVLDNFSKKYDCFVLLGDLNVQENETILSEFLNAYNAKNIDRNKTCFKSIENSSCVDLIIVDKPVFSIQMFLKQVYQITINLSQQF